MLEAHVQLADFKVKFRQADHAKKLLYGPVVISVVSFILTAVLAVFSAIQTRQTLKMHDFELQRFKASLIEKVLEAHSENDAKRLLAFFENAGLLTLPQAQRNQLESLVRRQ